jgi:hypothetical protein
MDTDKLQRLADNLREQETVADKFDMDEWIAADNWHSLTREFEGDTDEPCGTAACICGEGLLQFNGLSTKQLLLRESANIPQDFEVLFDLDTVQVSQLAHRDKWPVEYDTRYREADDDEERRQVAADRIEHFITHHQ